MNRRMNEIVKKETPSENKLTVPVKETTVTSPESTKPVTETTVVPEEISPVIEVKNPKVELMDDTATTSNETTLAKSSKAKATGILSGLGATVASLFTGI